MANRKNPTVKKRISSEQKRREILAREKRRANFNEWKNAFLTALLISTLMFFLMWPAGVKETGALAKGDFVTYSRSAVFFKRLFRNDLIIFNDKTVKKIVGLPGDHITVSDGLVYINGVRYYDSAPTPGDVNITVYSNEFFVLGKDNETSVIKAEEIKGKVIFKFFPFTNMKINI